MFRKFTQSYYARITLICFLIISVSSGAFFYINYNALSLQNTSEYLSGYNDVLSSQSYALSSRFSEFSELLYPIFSDKDVYNTFCNLYRSPKSQLDTDSLEVILTALNSICSSDSYCCGILLVTRSGLLYQYDTTYDSLLSLDPLRTSFSFTPYQLQILTDSQIKDMNSLIDLPANNVYGLANTLYIQEDNGIRILGYMIILYSTEEFTTIIDSAGLSPDAEYMIVDDSEAIIYSSSGNYDASLPEELLSGSSLPSGKGIRLISLDGTDYYVDSYYQSDYHYTVLYQIPAWAVPVSGTEGSLLIFCLLIPLLSIILYTLILTSSSKKVNNIRRAMEIVGQNNLSYRMAVPKGNNEFSSIARDLNRMCDELQKNMEDVYLFEISQHKSELYALQTSINPHFLYNTLEQIHVLIREGQNEDASRMLLLLSRMYRYQTRTDLFVSIAEECALIENLIYLYTYTVVDCDFEIEADNTAKIYGIPKNLLQPLIENSFLHGFSREQKDCRLTLTIRYVKEDNRILFRLQDNGASVTHEQLETILEKLKNPGNDSETNGFALSNVNRRLCLVFGEDSCLQLSSMEQTGFLVSFTVPAMLPEELQADYSNPTQA